MLLSSSNFKLANMLLSTSCFPILKNVSNPLLSSFAVRIIRMVRSFQRWGICWQHGTAYPIFCMHFAGWANNRDGSQSTPFLVELCSECYQRGEIGGSYISQASINPCIILQVSYCSYCICWGWMQSLAQLLGPPTLLPALRNLILSTAWKSVKHCALEWR